MDKNTLPNKDFFDDNIRQEPFIEPRTAPPAAGKGISESASTLQTFTNLQLSMIAAQARAATTSIKQSMRVYRLWIAFESLLGQITSLPPDADA